MEQDINQLIKAIYGTIVVDGLDVVPNSPTDNTVKINTGSGFINDAGTRYDSFISSQQQQTIDPVSGAGKERWDLISMTTVANTVAYTKGSEADTGNAVPPVVPDDEICLAWVYVNETTGNVDILATDIIDRRAIYGILPINLNNNYLVDTVDFLGDGYFNSATTSYQDMRSGFEWKFADVYASSLGEGAFRLNMIVSARVTGGTGYVELYNTTDAKQETEFSFTSLNVIKQVFPISLIGDENDFFIMRGKAPSGYTITVYEAKLALYQKLE